MKFVGMSASVAAVTLAFGSVSAPRVSKAQAAVVAVKSTDDLLVQMRAFVSQFDPAARQPAMQLVDAAQSGGLLKGIELSKPVTVTLDLIPPAPGGQPMLPQFAGFVPVTSQAEFLDLLKRMGVEAVAIDNIEGCSHRINLPGGKLPPLFLLKSPPEGYVIATNVPTNTDTLRAADPAALRPAGSAPVSARLRLDLIPEALREAVIAQTKAKNDVSRKRRDAESDADYRARLIGIDLAENSFTSLLREGRQLLLNLEIDPKASRFTTELQVDAKPDTAMAGVFGSLAAHKSRFQAIRGAAGLVLTGALPIPESLRTSIRDVFKALREKAEKEGKPAERRLARQLLDAIEPSVTGDELDACFTMDGTGPPVAGKKVANMVALIGVASKKAQQIDADFRELAVEAAKETEDTEVSVDLDRGPDGTRIHRIKPKQANDEARPSGDPTVFLAFPPGAALMAVGDDEGGLPALKHALGVLRDRVAGRQPSTEQVSLDISVERFGKALEQPEIYQKAVFAAFSDENRGKDHVHLGLASEGASLRLSLRTDLAVPRFFYELGNARQKGQGVAPR